MVGLSSRRVPPQSRSAHRSDPGQRRAALQLPRRLDRPRAAQVGACVRPYSGNCGAGMSSDDDRSDWPEALDEADLEALDRFLRAHAGEDDLLLDGVHGLLTAIRSEEHTSELQS